MNATAPQSIFKIVWDHNPKHTPACVKAAVLSVAPGGWLKISEDGKETNARVSRKGWQYTRANAWAKAIKNEALTGIIQHTWRNDDVDHVASVETLAMAAIADAK